MTELFQRPATLAEALVRHASVRPDQLALRFISTADEECISLDYRQLDERAKVVAIELANHCRKGDRAVLLLPSGVDYVAAFFGCLYAGVIAVPAYPPESTREQHLRRLLSIIMDAQPAVIVTSSTLVVPLLAGLEKTGIAPIAMVVVDRLGTAIDSAWCAPKIGRDDIAFLQYTSGSTSTPKGVMVSHGNLESNEWLIRNGYGFIDEDVLLSWLPLYHDMGLIGGLLQAIYSGVPVVLMSPHYFLERPQRWLEAISRYGGTVSGGPDFAYRLCQERVAENNIQGLDLSRWRVAFSGAEPIRHDTLQAFADKFSVCGFRPASYMACYGLAEATLYVTGARPGSGVSAMSVDAQALGESRVEAGSDTVLVSCGQVQPDHPVMIVDRDSGESLLDNRVGEIWISGPSISQGYWRRPEQTAETFIERDGTIWLRTGDLGFLRQGELFVTGRIKDLLIIRGQNLYPQDVERTVEERVDAVRKGRVAVFSVQQDGRESLGVAAEIGRRTGAQLSPDQLIRQILQVVAEAHQESPCLVVLLNPGALPKTSSGKLQRSACRTQLEAGTLDTLALFREGDAAAEQRTAEGPVAQRIEKLWREILTVDAVGSSDSFFALGGNSVRAIQMIAEIRDAFGIAIDLQTLFETPTLAQFTEAVERLQARNETPFGNVVTARSIGARTLPQSSAQERFWLLWQLDPKSVAYNIPGGLRLRGDLDEAALRASFAVLVARHESLRTRFYAQDGRGFQCIGEADDWLLQRDDLSAYPPHQRDERVLAIREEEACTPFDLELGPPLRVRLVVVDEQDHLLLVTMHHIIADGWSLNVLLEEFAQLYAAHVQGHAAVLPALPIQYADHALWQADAVDAVGRERQLAYWQAELGELDEQLALPLDRPSGRLVSAAARIERRLDKALCQRLQELASQRQVTLFMLLLAAFQVLLQRYSGQSDIRVGVPFANRDRLEVQRLIGLFLNTVVLRASVDTRHCFADFLGAVRDTALRAQANLDIPFENVAAALSAGADRPLFDVMFNHQQRDLSALRRLPGLLAEELPWHSREAKFPLQLHSEQDRNGNVRLAFDYAVDLFECTTIERMADRYVLLLEAICERPTSAIGDLALMDDAERRQLREWGRSTAKHETALLPELLTRQMQATPEALALIGGQQRLSYAELDARANALAHRLRELGVKPDVCVGIISERSIAAMIALLAIVKAGGTYVPLEPDHPDGRLEWMIRDSGVRLLIGSAHLDRLQIPDDVRVVPLEQMEDGEYREAPPPVHLHPDNLAYVIFTSGSTGLPKGVAVSHGALAKRLAWMRDEYRFDADDVLLQKAPLGFDVSAWECFLPLICGSRLVLAGHDEHRDPHRLVQLVCEHGVTAIHFVPSMWQQFVDEPNVGDCRTLRHLFSGGESLSVVLCNRIRERLPNAVLHNRYGPTETAINVTHWRCDRETPVRIPIGHPLADVVCELRMDGIELALTGARAELLIGGAGVAQGYRGRPALTAERFIPAENGGRLYRSGDLARWRGDGALEYLGRADRQIKLRGFRIETEEIRHQLLAQLGVRQAAVVLRDSSAGAQLVAYCCVDGDEPKLVLVQRLKTALQAQLPAYMVPAQFVFLDALPVTPNGKLDERALPAPEVSVREHVEPRTEHERQLAAIWCGVLGLARVGLNDDFFELGGHSLLATRIVSRVRQIFDIDLPLRSLFEASRFSEFSDRVAQVKAAGIRNTLGAIERVDRGQRIALSHSQQRMWFLWQLDPDSPAYNVGGMARIGGALDVGCFERALQALMQRHESLRTLFPSEHGKPYQQVQLQADMTLERLDFSVLPEDERNLRLQHIADQQAHVPFDLERGPLLRACLIRTADREHHLLLTLHHIVTEGWAMDIFARELIALYEAFADGRESPFQPLLVQYLDYSVWHRRWLEEGELQRQLAYWRERLGGEQPLLELPTDRPRPAVQSHRGELHRFEIDSALSARVRTFNAERGLTLFMTATAALAALLYRYSGQRDLRIGVPVANRIRPESENLIGAFLNTQVLRIEPDGQMRAGDLLAQVRETVIGGQSHQDLPFDQLVEALQPVRSAAYNPLFQVMCNVQRWEFQQTREIAGGLRIEYLVNDARATKFDLNLEVTDIDEQLRCCLTYSTDLFERDTVERMARHWRNLLQSLVDGPDVPLSELAMYDRGECAALDAPCRERIADDAPGVHALFERQVLATPNAPAVTIGDASLSYAELNVRANRIAHRLRALGVGPEVRVGLLLQRSVEMVAALLGVMKAGGAYVPLDPEYPHERLRYMIEDSGVTLLLAHKASIDRVAVLADTVPVLNLDDDSEFDAARADNPRNLSRPDHLAYLIYTSGSTGRPKGVAVTHGPLTMHCCAVGQLFGMTPDDCELHFYSINFDAASERLLVPLLCGAHVVLRAEGQWDAEQICDTVRAHGVNVLGFTPSYGRQLAQWLNGRGERLPMRLCIAGGEALTAEHRDEIETAFAPELFFNAYGPTETVVMPLACPVSGLAADGAASLPIGDVVGARTLHLLDADLTPVPPGASGEIYVGGDWLARGYHGRPGLSAERFVADPFAGDGGRLYRTGDRARRRRDGLIEYIGRIDQQVKIRGFRIELGEIEARLQAHAEIDEAVVLAVDGPSSRQLVAYLVPANAALLLAESGAAQATLCERLRAHLHADLPDYMVPTHLMFIARIPLTVNGKLDRASLPAPDLRATAAAHQPPRSDAERTLVTIWRDVLGVTPGIDDNFFELGGDSILSIQVVSRARQAGLHFTAKDLFQHQNIRALAGAAKAAPVSGIEQGALTGESLLTPIQHWFFERDLPRPGHWNQSLLLQARRRLRPRWLQRALQLLVEYHDGLRLRFRPDGNESTNWHAGYQIGNEASDLLWLRRADSEAEQLALYEEVQRSLDIEHGPLLRAVLVEGKPDRLLLVAHHLVVDGVSWRVLLEDLQSLYQQLQRQQSPSLPPKTSSQRDWVARLQAYADSESLREESGWWRAQLAGAPIGLPLDGDEGVDPAQVNLERHSDSVILRLNAAPTRKLLKLAPQAYRTRVDDLLLAALARTLCQWTGEASTLVQVEGHGREALFDEIDLSRSVGWFTSLYPVRLTPAAEIDQSVKAIKEQLRAVPHRGLGYGVLRYLADDVTRAAMAALPQPRITFNYLGQFDRGTTRGALLRLLDEPTGTRHDGEAPLPNWLNVDCQVLGGELQMRWTFSNRLYRSETVRQLAEAYRRELRTIINHCTGEQAGGITPSDFPLVGLTQTQLDALPVPFRAIEDIYPLTPMQEGLLLHTLLEPGTGIYFMQDRYCIDSALDVERFDRAWRAVIARHEALRASFCWTAGESMLQIIHREAAEGVDFIDWSALPAVEHEARLQALLKEERVAGFDLLERPPLRLRLIKLAPEQHWFIMSNHHILIDAWCRSLLMGDFLDIYQSLGAGSAPVLETPPRYRDFIAWLRGRDRAASHDWWRTTLAGFERPTYLPSDRPILQGDAAADGGMRVGDRHARLDAEQGARLRELAQRHQLTVNTFAQAAWALVLRRYSSDRDVLFGVTVAGRPAELPQMQRAVGLFINTVPLRVPMPDVGQRRSVQQWLRDLFERNLALREHEHVPLVEIQECSELPKGRQPFDSLFVFENAPVEHSVLDRAQGLNARSASGRTHTNYPLTVVCYPGDALGLHLSYDQRFFEESTIDRLLADFRRLLLALADGFHGDFSELPLLDDGERRFQLEQWNDTAADYPLDDGYVPLFEARAAADPLRIVARCQGAAWSYDELDRRANCLGNRLLACGVEPDRPVALLAERGLPLLGMMVGSFKAGAGCLSLDPSHPRQRLLHILRASAAPVLVCAESCIETARDLLDELPEELRPQLLVWEEVQTAEGDERAPGVTVNGQHLAYVIYTSGSTGTPKGVVVEQAGMLNNQLSKVPYLQLTERDVIAQTASQSFDISAWQFLTAPLCGACIEIVPDEIARDPAALLQHVRDSGITVLESVPSMIQAMLDERYDDLGMLRCLLPTGEAMPPELARQWLQRHPGVALINAYGPAECSDDVALFRVDEASTRGSRLPIGGATDNNRLYLLDDDLQPVPAAAIGELFIAGVGVGRGYIGDPVRTAQSFLPNPCDGGGRIYRSGDLALRRADGVLEYAGRTDHQVKIRGFRIELGEIEARLYALPEIREAAVAVQEGPGGSHLVGYVVGYVTPADNSLLQPHVAGAPPLREMPDAVRESLQRALRETLPDYMVPSHWLLLEHLPLNANGKLDRKALPAPEFGSRQHHHIEPRNALEQTLAAIWRDVLDADSIGVTDDFFQLGGHSLLATQIVSRAQQTLQRNVPLRAMFECRTVEELASYIESLDSVVISEQKAHRLDDLMTRLEMS